MADLTLYEANAKAHPPEQVNAVAKSITEFGFTTPVLIDSDNVVIAGHCRLAAAVQLGIATVPTLRLDHLTPEQVRAYRLADNRLTEMGTWDTGLLQAELQALSMDDFDISVLGFSEEDMDRLAAELGGDEQGGASGATPAGETRGAASAESDGSAEVEWYTPLSLITQVRDFMGGIDLDPASSDRANDRVRAARHFTIKDNGLEQEWRAERVFMNPPYEAIIREFCTKFCDEHEAGNIGEGLVLVKIICEAAWWQRLAQLSAAYCMIKKRVEYESTDGRKQALQYYSQSLHYFGPRATDFAKAFNGMGVIVAPLVEVRV